MKRFYKKAGVKKAKGGFGVTLDGKAIRTPAKNLLQVPKKALAEAMAEEWEKQKKIVNAAAMPLNRLANTAIDRTAPRFDEVAHEALNFALHDLVCYRADEPRDLAKAEAKAWDSYLDWLKKAYGAELKVTSGIGSIPQDPRTVKVLKDVLEALDPFTLTGLHNATTLTGSLVLGLALLGGHKRPRAIWKAAHVDEDYQAAKWGEDLAAAKILAEKKALFLAVDKFLRLLK